MKSRILAGAAAAALCLTALSPSLAADAAAPKKFANCAAVHKVYSGGIAKPGVTTNLLTKNGKKVRVPLNGNVKHSLALYKKNRGLDRDDDKVACEV